MKTFEITKEQIIELSQYYYSQSNLEMALKEWFPQAFESELEVGKWYKNNDYNNLVYLEKITNKRDLTNDFGTFGIGYGFTFSDNPRWSTYLMFANTRNFELATDKEVETALIEEAKRRGFKEGVTFKNFNGANQTFLSFYGLNESFNELFSRTPKEEWGNKNCNSNPYIFKDGKWAEIINEPLTLTIDEIAEKFGTTADKIKICK